MSFKATLNFPKALERSMASHSSSPHLQLLWGNPDFTNSLLDLIRNLFLNLVEPVDLHSELKNTKTSSDIWNIIT